MPPPSQDERRAATRAALVRAGRGLFAARGFADVPADAVVEAAGVSRGALHHHFGDKRGLFRAVFEELEAEVTADLVTLVGDGQDDLLRRALSAFRDICERPEVSRIALTDAPAVLGWSAWRQIERQHGLGLLAALLAADQGPPRDSAPELAAQLVLGAVIEAALVVANADDRATARREVEAGLVEVLGALLPTPPQT